MTTNIKTLEELNTSILYLQTKQINDIHLLKEQFKITYEQIKPATLIKHAIGEIIAAPDFKKGLINTALSYAAGKLTQKVIVGSTHNPIKNLLGTLLQLGVSNVVSKNGDDIKSGALKLLGNLFKRKEKVPYA